VKPDPEVLGTLVMALAALLGIGAGCVGLFVLRVEHIAWTRRVEAIERRLAERADAPT